MADRDGPVAVLTLNRPEVRNALNAALVGELLGRLREANEDASVRAVVLSAAPPAFCAGADLHELVEGEPHAARRRVELTVQLHTAIPALRKPVIAAVSGAALAGGCGLAMSCDVVIASERASFGYPEVRRGLVAAVVMASLQRSVGRRVAMDLLLSGRRIDAEEALRIGMVTELVSGGSELATALQRAHEFAQHPPSAVAMTKELFYRVSDLPYPVALRQAGGVSLLMRRSTEARSGAAEFFGEGKPHV